MRVVYTAGVFDLLHPGHVRLLRRSRALGDFLLVGVVSDRGAMAYKGSRPVMTTSQRREVVDALACVDGTVIQKTTDPSRILRLIRPAVMTHGDDWASLLEGHDTLREVGCEWVTLPYTEGISTTTLRERIA